MPPVEVAAARWPGGVQGDGADGLGLAERDLVGGAGAQRGRLAGRDRLRAR
jgi:hypothetical protein